MKSETTQISTTFIILIIFLSLFVIAGCSMFVPGSPEKAMPGENDVLVQSSAPAQTAQQPASAQTAVPSSTPASASASTQAAATEATVDQATDNTTGATDSNGLASTEAKVSGSLTLQQDVTLCPHLATGFSCDKYDLRGCGYSTLMTKEGFHPEVLNCKDGIARNKEDPADKYCLLQDCKSLAKGNIVYAVGGKTAYAEYSYTKESTETGISLTYTLKSCGETEMEFADKNNCMYYRTSSGLFS